MSVKSVLSPIQAPLRQGFDAAAHLLGFTEVRTDRDPALLTIRLGPPGEAALAVIDRRDGQHRTDRLDAGAEDLAERLAAIRGGRAGLRVRILVDPALCFVRSLDLPGAALPQMRAVLAQELEAATPFRADQVLSDWYVEGEDTAARSLRVRHVVLKRARLDPLLATLARAGLVAGQVAVGPAEDRTMPVDLLTGGHRTLPGLLRGAGTGNLLLMAGALLLLLGAFFGLRQHQEARLRTLDDAFVAARRAAGPPPPAVQAGIAAILAERGPPLGRTWDALAAALPDTVSAQSLRLTGEGLDLTLTGPDPQAALAALGTIPGFGPPILREAAGTRIVVALPRTEARR